MARVNGELELANIVSDMISRAKKLCCILSVIAKTLINRNASEKFTENMEKDKYKEVRSLSKNDGWSFAIVNGRLAEIHFDKKFGIWGHSYEKESSYKTKKEKKWIKADTKKYQFIYKKRFYYDKIRKLKQKAPNIKKMFAL